jgi:hypothetical protein
LILDIVNADRLVSYATYILSQQENRCIRAYQRAKLVITGLCDSSGKGVGAATASETNAAIKSELKSILNDDTGEFVRFEAARASLDAGDSTSGLGSSCCA